MAGPDTHVPPGRTSPKRTNSILDNGQNLTVLMPYGGLTESERFPAYRRAQTHLNLMEPHYANEITASSKTNDIRKYEPGIAQSLVRGYGPHRRRGDRHQTPSVETPASAWLRRVVGHSVCQTSAGSAFILLGRLEALMRRCRRRNSKSVWNSEVDKVVRCGTAWYKSLVGSSRDGAIQRASDFLQYFSIPCRLRVATLRLAHFVVE